MIAVLIRASNNQPVTLGKQIANSGEGIVSETNLSGYLAKIYHNPTLERIEKLKVMLANPPVDPMASQHHISIAFPLDLLQDQSGAVVGFLMPAIRDSRELYTVYHPSLRKKKAPGFNWYYLHITALNTAWIIQAIHEKGYVLGDIKPQNILVNDRALVAVIDTDSFQVCDAHTGKVYLCHVGSEGFTPVELLGKDFSATYQTEIHDRFRLAVLIHYLLFGYHPFSGQWLGVGESPDQTELIRQGLWYGGKNNSIRPSQNTISLDVVHPAIKQCFLKCFNDGHTAPHLRPTAQEWRMALKVGLEDLIVCQNSDSHYHSQNYGKCYWCERTTKLGVDIFPPIPGSSIGIKTATGTTVLRTPNTADPTQLLQFLPRQIQNPRKYWQVLMGIGLGSLAITTAAGMNLLSQNQSLTSSSPIIPPYSSSVPSPNHLVNDSDDCAPESSNRNGCKGAVKDPKKAEQAEMELLKQEQERQSALVAKEKQAVAEAEQEQDRQLVAEAEQEQDRQLVAEAEQARLEAGRQKRERQAALRLERTRQTAIRANERAEIEQARSEAGRQKRERQVALRLKQSRQARIGAERRRQIAIKALDKTSSPQKHKHQERSINQDANSVNSAKPWESRVLIKRASDDLENIIKGEKP